MPVNPKGGTIFGYEPVTAIGDIDSPVDLAAIVIRPDAFEAAGLVAERQLVRRAFSRSSRSLISPFQDLTGDFHGCCIFATFCWTCGLSVASIGRSRAMAWGADRGRLAGSQLPLSTSVEFQ